MRILIAEDDRTSRTMLRAILLKWGYEPVTAENGAQAWEILQSPDAPMLLLLDWNMPEMDGVDVICRVRASENTESPYILLLTSLGEKTHIVAGLEAGANDYIVKPYDPDELRARLHVGQRMLELQAELRESRDARAYEAMHDSLTGAMNRRAMLEALPRELSRSQRENSGVCIGMCDIDHFKAVNDTYGHSVGDEVLCGFVGLLESKLRKYDYVGRWGGEEFLVITPCHQEDDPGVMFERVREACAGAAQQTSAGEICITVSIGVAVWNGQETAEHLVGAADAALYTAKNQGRNQICVAEIRPWERSCTTRRDSEGGST